MELDTFIHSDPYLQEFREQKAISLFAFTKREGTIINLLKAKTPKEVINICVTKCLPAKEVRRILGY